MKKKMSIGDNSNVCNIQQYCVTSKRTHCLFSMVFFVFDSDIEAKQYKITRCCVSMAKMLIFLSCFDARVIQTYKMSTVRAILFATLMLLENDPIVLHGMTK